jgi:L-lysine exporter family protein LysE/ArgO
MFEPIILGFSAGVILSFGFGSVFFALIQNSLDYGYKAGIKISLGVVFGDILMVAIAYYGTSFLPKSPDFIFYSRLFGSLLLIGLGISQFRVSKPPSKIQDFKLARFFYFFGKGFLLNVINPVNFIAWVLLSSTLKGYHYSLLEEILFFSTCILMIFVIESLIAYFSYRVKEKLNEKTIQYIKYVTGMVFIGVGLKLIYDLI